MPPTATQQESAIENKLGAVISVGALRSIVAAVLVLVEDAKLSLSPQGLTSRFVDKAHVAMGTLKVPSTVFQSYDAGTFDLALNMQAVANFLKLAGDKEPASIQADAKGCTISVGGLRRHFPAIDGSAFSDVKAPPVELPNSAQEKAGILATVAQAAAQIGDCLTVRQIDGNHFVLHAQADGAASVTYELPDNQAACPQPGETGVALEYVQEIVGLPDAETPVTIATAKDMPIRFTWTEGNASFEYLVAPRIDSE